MSEKDRIIQGLDVGDKLLDAELEMVQQLERMFKTPPGYQTHIVDPRQFTSKSEGVNVSLGIAPKGVISQVTSQAEFNICTVIIRPTIDEQGELGMTETSRPNQVISPELSTSIGQLADSVMRLNKLIGMF